MHSFKLSITGIIAILSFYFKGFMISGVHAGIQTKVTAIRGQEVALTCFTGTFTGNVTWYVHYDPESVKITTCVENKELCGDIGPVAILLARYNGTRTETTTTLKVVSQGNVGVHECRVNGETLRSYEFTFVNKDDIEKPACTAAPLVLSDEFQLDKISFTCDSSANEGIIPFLQIDFEEESTGSIKSTHLTHITKYAFFTDTSLKGSCEMSIEGVSETWSCVFPTHVNITPTTKGTDMEFECHAGATVESHILWSLLEPDDPIDIMNRSWIRGEGRSMLLREMTTDDYGRVVQCRVHQPGDPDNITFIGFYQIKHGDDFTLTSSRDPNGSNAAEPQSTTTTYRILFAFFFILWLLTVGIFLAWVVYPSAKAHWQLSTAGLCHQGKEQSTGVGEGNAGNGQGIQVTYVDKKSAVNTDECNSSFNNNASSGDQRITIPSREPVASTSLQSEANAVDNPLYFCVDRSSPPPLRSPPMSDEGIHDGVSESCSDVDLEGYDIVGESDQATCLTFSTEQSEYAEVTVRNNSKRNADSYLYGVVKK